MRVIACCCVVLSALLTVPEVAGETLPGWSVVEGGGAAGGPALYLNNGDLIGVRNVQGGTVTGQRDSLNLDIGAGSTENPGDIALNYDVGRDVLIYDGHKHLIARIGASGIRFYVRPHWPRPSWANW